MVELSELEFLDSTGVAALVRMRAVLGREDRALGVVCPPGPVRRMLELAGIADLLELFDSREQAAAALRPGRVRRRDRPFGVVGCRVSETPACAQPWSARPRPGRGRDERCRDAADRPTRRSPHRTRRTPPSARASREAGRAALRARAARMREHSEGRPTSGGPRGWGETVGPNRSAVAVSATMRSAVSAVPHPGAPGVATSQHSERSPYASVVRTRAATIDGTATASAPSRPTSM